MKYIIHSGLKTVLFLLLGLLNTVSSFSQDGENRVYFHPFQLQVNLNYSRSLPDLSVQDKQNARSEDIYNGKTFGSDEGFGAAVQFKIRLGKRSRFYLTQSLAYNRILSYDFRSNTAIPDNGYGRYNVLTAGAGLEYYFTINRKLALFTGLQLNAGLINGSTGIWLQRIGHIAGDTNVSYVISNSFRIGFSLNAGTEYMINKNLGLNIGLRLMYVNAFLKSSDGNNEEEEFHLRDDNKSGLIFAGNKNFVFYCISGGLNIYIDF